MKKIKRGLLLAHYTESLNVPVKLFLDDMNGWFLQFQHDYFSTERFESSISFW